MRSWRLLASALVCVAVTAGSAKAQGVMPGGWGPQIGYQAFAGPNVAVAGGSFGFGFPAYGAYGSAYGLGGMGSYGSGYGYPQFGAGAPVARSFGPFDPGAGTFLGGPGVSSTSATNAVNPLIHSVRQATRRRHRR
jgi:hypothetical protein